MLALRRFLSICCWAGLVACITACTSAPPQITSTELTLYSFTEYVPTDLIEAFQTQTGITVHLETYANNEEMLAGLAANPTKYDLVIPSDYTVDLLIKADELRPLDLAVISNYNNINRAFLRPYFDPGGLGSGRASVVTNNEKYSLPYQWGTTGIAYDKTKITEPITSWADLWRPELAGHLVVLDDPRELMGMALLTLGYDKNSTNPAELAAARDKLKALAPSIIAYDSATPEQYLLNGEAWAGVVFNGNAALAARQNPNIVYSFPAEGAGIWFDSMAIPVGAPHADAAQAFINFVLEPAQSVLITRDFPYSNPNQAALEYLQQNDPAAYAAYQASPTTNPPADVVDAAKPVKNVATETAQLFQSYWAEVTGK